MKDIQQHMQAFLERMVDEGRERGVQLAAYYEGQLIVDASAGIADRRTGQAVDGSTIFPVFSTTKGIASTVLHHVMERQGTDYDLRIAELWPEFGVHGKERATIRHALSHTTGIPHMPEGVGLAEVVDWDRMTAETAKLVPQWPPGERMEYHAITFGWIVGEIASRLDGRPFARILKEDICDPLGIQDELFVGIPEEAEARVAFLEEPGFDPSAFPATGLQAIPAWICPLADWMNRSDARRACVPASNGIMSARAIAKHYAALLQDGADGIRLLPESRIRLATALQDLPNQEPQYKGLGYQVGSPGSIMGGASAFGHGGYGGSNGFADPERRLAVAYVNNLYTPQSAGTAIIHELKKELGIAID